MPNCMWKDVLFGWRKKDPDVALHVFPKDMEIIKTWLLHINQDFGDLDEFCHKIFNSSKGTYRICSQHFPLDAYEIRGMVTFLKKDAIPYCIPSRKNRITNSKKEKKDNPTSHSEADTSTTVNMPFTSTAFSMPVELDMPLNPKSHCLDLRTTQSAATSAHSYKNAGQQFDKAVLYKCKHYISQATRTIGTSIDYFPGQVHQSTQLNKPMGTKDKNLQTNLKPLYRSVGIQCNLDDLPNLPSRSPVTRIGASRHFSYENWTKLLHSQSYACFHDNWQ